jgi:hypothetical protein
MKTKLRWCQFHSEKNFTNLSLIKSDTSRRGHSSAATSPCLSAGSNLYCSFINKIWLRLKIPRMIMISLVLSFIFLTILWPTLQHILRVRPMLQVLHAGLSTGRKTDWRLLWHLRSRAYQGLPSRDDHKGVHFINKRLRLLRKMSQVIKNTFLNSQAFCDSPIHCWWNLS